MTGYIRKLVTILALIFVILPLSVSTQSQTLYTCTSSILAHFNSTPIGGGTSIWLSASLASSGEPTSTATISVNQYMITFGQQPSGVPYQCHNFPPVNTLAFFNPPGEAVLTYYNSLNFWKENVPLKLSGNVFLTGCTIPPCASGQNFDCVLPNGLPANMPVTWTMQFQSTKSTPIVWQWSAAVYSQFAACKELEECQGFGPLGVKAVDNSSATQSCVDSSSNCSTYANSDNAGTPENYKGFLVGGAMGTGGTNYVGTRTSTASCSPVSSPCQVSLLNSCGQRALTAQMN